MRPLLHGWNTQGIIEHPTAELLVQTSKFNFKIWFSNPLDFDKTKAVDAFTPELWKHDCAEIFLRFDNERYFEFNVSPSGAVWWQMMRGIRTADPAFSKDAVSCSTCIYSKNLITVELTFNNLPLPQPRIGNICVIQTIDGVRRFFFTSKTAW